MIAGAGRKAAHEESPGSAGQRCRVTPGEGDFKESATERYRMLDTRNQKLEFEMLSSVFDILVSSF